jgi:hypothetical protein
VRDSKPCQAILFAKTPQQRSAVALGLPEGPCLCFKAAVSSGCWLWTSARSPKSWTAKDTRERRSRAARPLKQGTKGGLPLTGFQMSNPANNLSAITGANGINKAGGEAQGPQAVFPEVPSGPGAARQKAPRAARGSINLAALREVSRSRGNLANVLSWTQNLACRESAMVLGFTVLCYTPALPALQHCCAALPRDTLEHWLLPSGASHLQLVELHLILPLPVDEPNHQVFLLPRAAAADRLGISVNCLKRSCRRVGIR